MLVRQVRHLGFEYLVDDLELGGGDVDVVVIGCSGCMEWSAAQALTGTSG